MENIKAVIYNLHIKPQLNLRISNITKSVKKCLYYPLYLCILFYIIWKIYHDKKKFHRTIRFVHFPYRIINMMNFLISVFKGEK